MSSIEPFNRLIKLAARAFYDTSSPTKGETPGRNGRGDNTGIAVVVLDALTRRQWVRDEDLAKDLKLHAKQLRRTLRFFEEEKLVTRDHRKETSKGVKLYNNAAAATTGEGQQAGREGDEKIKMHTHSYSCLDYAQIYDVVRYRLHRMKKKLKDELESKNTIQEYVCPNCSKRYTAFDALRLVSPYDEYFHCESCNGVLAAESDKLAAEDLGDGDDNARKRRHEKIKDMLTKMEEQLKPLVDQLARVKDLPVPEYGNLQAWELRANSASRSSTGELNASDPSRSTQGLGFGGTPMPYVGETQVEVAFSGISEKGENATLVNADRPTKVLPPWMIKEGMSLTTEQRGEPNKEIKVGGTLTASDDKKSTSADDEAKKIQDEYIKAYYAALLIRQREQEEMANKEQEVTNATISNEVYDTNNERQIGMKSKRDDDYDRDGVKLENPPTGGRTERFKVMDLNMEAEPSDSEEEEIDWEEG